MAGGLLHQQLRFDRRYPPEHLRGSDTRQSYYPSLDSLHAVVVGGTQYFAHYDALGNVIALTDTAENVARTYEYAPWGALTGGADNASLSNADRARFKGAVWGGPDVDVYYMRHRWYEPKSGRFLTEDPLGLAGGVNQYAFAGDDPVNNVDPTGLDYDPCPPGYEPVTVEEMSLREIGNAGSDQCRLRRPRIARAHYAYAAMMGVPGFATGWGAPGWASFAGAGGTLHTVLFLRNEHWKKCEPDEILMKTPRWADLLNQRGGIWTLTKVRVADHIRGPGGVRVPIPGGVGVYVGIFVSDQLKTDKNPLGSAQADGFIGCALGWGVFTATPGELP